MEKKGGRQTISRTITRLLSIALVLALAVVVANAQMECLAICEQNYAQCLRNQGNGPNFSASCLEIYEQCAESCIGAQAGVILG